MPIQTSKCSDGRRPVATLLRDLCTTAVLCYFITLALVRLIALHLDFLDAPASCGAASGTESLLCAPLSRSSRSNWVSCSRGEPGWRAGRGMSSAGFAIIPYTRGPWRQRTFRKNTWKNSIFRLQREIYLSVVLRSACR
ncbi:hypothetical protein B0H12DRAFT_287429 [Mycena haematopus]|nr:hypothetical protein B0H12DRAFT_287429 [Mycena haematopus]